MSAIIAIDPGYAKAGGGCAYAVLLDGSLVAVGFVRYGTADARIVPTGPREVRRIVWEKPQYDSRSRVIDPRALIDLAEVGAGLANLWAGQCDAPVIALTPTEWKGAQEKPKHHWRVWQALDARERAVLGGDATRAAIDAACGKGAACRWRRGTEWYPRGWLTHNLLDACALAKRAEVMR